MNAQKIKDCLLRLGFYFVEDRNEDGGVVFYAGHVDNCKFPLVYMREIEGQGGVELRGPYSNLVSRLVSASDRYELESQDVVVLPPEMRAEWVSKLAVQAGVTGRQFSNFIRALQ